MLVSAGMLRRCDSSAVHIVFLSTEHPSIVGHGGIGSYVGTIGPALVARGHEVTVITCGPGRAERESVIDGVRVLARPWVRVPGLGRFLGKELADRLRAAFTCWRELHRLPHAADVVEVAEWMAEGLLVQLFGTPPVVVHLHTPHGRLLAHAGAPITRADWLADRLERWSAAHASAVTAGSRLLVDDLLRSGWLPVETQPEVIGLPVDVTCWDGLPAVRTTPPKVVCIGRVEARKAPEVVVRAVSRTGIPGASVTFVGRSSGAYDGGPYSLRVEALATQLSVRVEMAGEHALDEVRHHLASARVAVVASTFESFSLAAVEGMAAGRPVVLSDAVGAGELVADLLADAVIPVGDDVALGIVLARYLADADLAERDGQRLKDRVSRICTPDAVAAVREQLYIDVVAQEGQRRPRPTSLGRRPNGRVS